MISKVEYKVSQYKREIDKRLKYGGFFLLQRSSKVP